MISLDLNFPYLFGLRCRADAIHFGFSTATYLNFATLLPHKFSDTRFSGDYVNWLIRDLTNRQSVVHVSEILSLSFEIIRDLVNVFTFQCMYACVRCCETKAQHYHLHVNMLIKIIQSNKNKCVLTML